MSFYKWYILILTCITPLHVLPLEEFESQIERIEERTELRSPDNKVFNNLRVYNTLHTRDLYVEDSTIIGGDLKVKGSIHGGCGTMYGPSSSTPNSLVRFADATGSSLIDSPIIVDDSGNISGVNNLTATLITADLNGTALNTAFVGDQSAANVAAATTLALSATSDNIFNTLIQRDETGSFITTQITITGHVSNPLDIATKEYVDTTAGLGLVIKAPVRAVSTTQVPLTGEQTIDGIALVASTTVLLVGQTTAIENGLWVVQAGPWIRPDDFKNPQQAGSMYVLATEGTLYGGSGWVCVTPTAIIDADDLSFVQFSSPGSVTGDNVGAGTGEIFAGKTGNLIEFKTIIAGNHLLLSNNTEDITLTVSALSASLPNTLVMRDAEGNFSANTITASLIGAASENILRSGDSMTGTFTVIAGSESNPSLQFAQSNNTGFSAELPNTLVLSTDGVARMSISPTGTITINAFTTDGIVHNNASGELSSSLIIDADIADNAQIADTKLATISTPGKVLDSATTATSASIPNTIVKRDEFGNFAANIITANSIIGASSGNVLKAGDTMTGTFTVIAGTASNPSLQFFGSNNTGLSAQTPNHLVFSTDGSERMSISPTGTVTINTALVLPASTVTSPALEFVAGSQTGLSSPTSDSLEIGIRGNKRLIITDTAITVTGAPLVLSNVMCMQATQTALVASGDDITIHDGIATLVLSYDGNVNPLTIRLPNSPMNGQLITIKAIRLSEGDLGDENSITYIPAFNPASEGITELSPNANLAGNAGGASVTYIYLSTETGVANNGWYRYARG